MQMLCDVPIGFAAKELQKVKREERTYRRRKFILTESGIELGGGTLHN